MAKLLNRFIKKLFKHSRLTFLIAEMSPENSI